MEVNFKIVDNIAISFNGNYLDLQNNFKLIDAIIKNNGKFMQLIFTKLDGDWVKKDEFSKIVMTFDEIDYLYDEPADPEAKEEDKNYIDDITFYPSIVRDVNDGIMTEPDYDQQNDIIFWFEDARLLRIHSKIATVEVEK
jgi:hypothetical protein